MSEKAQSGYEAIKAHSYTEEDKKRFPVACALVDAANKDIFEFLYSSESGCVGIPAINLTFELATKLERVSNDDLKLIGGIVSSHLQGMEIERMSES